MSIAPSERHLEDWIVEHLPSRDIGYNKDVPEPYENYPAFLCGYLIGRQVKLPHGRADLIIGRHNQIYVVELKKNMITEPDLVQLMRYVTDMRMIVLKMISQSPAKDLEGAWEWRLPEVHGALVGHALKKNENINVAAYCIQMSLGCFTYNYYEPTATYKIQACAPPPIPKPLTDYITPNLRDAIELAFDIEPCSQENKDQEMWQYIQSYTGPHLDLRSTQRWMSIKKRNESLQ